MQMWKRGVCSTAVVVLVVVALAACSARGGAGAPAATGTPAVNVSAAPSGGAGMAGGAAPPATVGPAGEAPGTGDGAARMPQPAGAAASEAAAGGGSAAAAQAAATVEPAAAGTAGPAATAARAAEPPAPTAAPAAAAAQASSPVRASGKLVMLDPGHQRRGNSEPEPVGPDTRETKAKVSSGTTGVSTKKPEYVLNLEVSLLLRDELRRRGFEVAMTRETHDVDLSNKQRAEMSNEAGAALTVRIHADGDSSASTRGFSVLYPSISVAATKPIAAESKEAASFMLAGLQAATGQKGRGLSAREDLSGFNWSKVPVILAEIGFMTNPEEDERMSEADYQQQLVRGMADGIERFLADR
ncbi:N-acetylmuramoyl-L-alanine amidase family protein [Paenibacillus ferrarius]|uniref:N-acetylmuramoyl-L-alanine amidase family protein n=1 Tax=Paenibacillus ferrarius TaxID=1469647 RepID=UPI003D28AD78